jgi:mono/diheme cytochrome c family protein
MKKQTWRRTVLSCIALVVMVVALTMAGCAGNDSPTADAGPNQTVAVGDTVRLDGSGSSDPDGDILIYQWSFVSRPAGSTAALSNTTNVNPTFVADVAGDYMVQLIVNDGTDDSAPDTVTITAQATGATVADLQNRSFMFPDGAAFGLTGPVTLAFGTFDASNTAPFTLTSGTNTASGVATLGSIDLAVETRTPSDFAIADQMSLDDRIANGILSLTNTATRATSTADSTGQDISEDPSSQPLVLRAIWLSGPQEVPGGVSTDASGSATFSITRDLSGDPTGIAYTLSYTGTNPVTQAHIHVGQAGENGSILLWLCQTTTNPAPEGIEPVPPTCPAAGEPVSGTLNATSLAVDTANPGSAAPSGLTVGTFVEAVDAMRGGSTYVNVHTETNPSGEIRSQIGPAMLDAIALSGTQEPDSVPTTGSGSATVDLNDTQTQMSYALDYAAINAVTQSHIHVGQSGENGSILLWLCQTTTNPAPEGIEPVPPTCPTAGTQVAGTLTATQLVPDANAPGTAPSGLSVATFTQAVNAVLSGNTYVNVHTEANPGGEIRGQLGPARLSTTLSGDQEPGVVTTDGSGTAVTRLSAMQDGVTYRLSYMDTATPTQAHIHVGTFEENGGILFWLCQTEANPAPAGIEPPTCPDPSGTVNGTLVEADLLPATSPSGLSVETGFEAINAMLSGNTYVNVHSTAFPGGEIRGQLGRVPPGNQAPIADAGVDQNVSVGDTVRLNGSGSSDPDGDTLTYTWSLTAPTGSTATLSDPAMVNPTFVADVAGTYQAQLIVNDGTEDSAPDTVTITAQETGGLDGAQLYADNCAICHGADGSGGAIGGDVQGMSAESIQNAINTVPLMASLSSLTPEEIEAIAGFLAAPPAP